MSKAITEAVEQERMRGERIALIRERSAAWRCAAAIHETARARLAAAMAAYPELVALAAAVNEAKAREDVARAAVEEAAS